MIGLDGLPVPRPNHYALFIRRPRIQASSLAEELATIATVYEWSHRREIDIEDRFHSGNGLTPSEIQSLLDFLRLTRAYGRSVAPHAMHVVDPESIVSSGVHRNRVLVARDFLVWGMDETLARLDVRDPRYRHIAERRDRMRRIADSYELPTRSKRREGLPGQLRSRFLEVIDPGYPTNPFNAPVRFRNYVLLMLLMLFGLRRGEALKLYVSDLSLRGASKPTMRILRRPDDPNDPRRDEPRVKTLGREIPLDRATARLLSEFVLEHRPRFGGADVSPFLFISSHGQPMSTRQVNDVVEQICARFSEFRDVLTPHVLRHTYNDLLSETARQQNIREEEEQQLRNYLNGWSPRSNQGDRYRQRYIAERASNLSLEHQRRILHEAGRI